MKASSIHEDLKNKIIWLELRPETILNLSRLAEEYQVSRTPIKETLIGLSYEGWIIRNGNNFVVTPLSMERIKSITEIRYMLEPPAMNVAADRIQDDEIKKLKNLEKKLNNLPATTSNRALIQMDVDFHNILYKATRNEQLEYFLTYSLEHYLRFWLTLPQKIEIDTFFDDTKLLIQSFSVGDKDRIQELTFHHIERSLNSIKPMFV